MRSRSELTNPPSGIDYYTFDITGVLDPAPFPVPLLQTTIDDVFLDGNLGVWHAVGTIKNNSSTTYDPVWDCTAWYNAAGDVIRMHVGNTSPSSLGPGQTGTFDAFAIGVTSEVDSVVVIASD